MILSRGSNIYFDEELFERERGAQLRIVSWVGESRKLELKKWTVRVHRLLRVGLIGAKKAANKVHSNRIF